MNGISMKPQRLTKEQKTTPFTFADYALATSEAHAYAVGHQCACYVYRGSTRQKWTSNFSDAYNSGKAYDELTPDGYIIHHGRKGQPAAFAEYCGVPSREPFNEWYASRGSIYYEVRRDYDERGRHTGYRILRQNGYASMYPENSVDVATFGTEALARMHAKLDADLERYSGVAPQLTEREKKIARGESPD